MTDTTIVHLLRHGEVHNPERILYGRLPGYRLSEDGVLMAKAASRWFADRDVTALFSSPMQRALETAAPLADALGLPVTVDDRLIEAGNHFEGLTFGVGTGSLRRPEHWRHLVNPFRPSWGEPYKLLVARMRAVVIRARETALGHEAVCVSHQLPIWILRLHAEHRRLWHHPARRECALASLTSLTFEGSRLVEVAYSEPAAGIATGPDVAGA
ncbi:histidine phosphatase family protein [Actinomadura citrea]|jgi:broad specificity phosphatase PhoE|uniref:Broad specificity phosphatase PhoE n=1 Tax=Actinomadura citrea TaxID=46158 RepID=A0A7Y9GJ41_9ACTN|nr:histidine phosphatase family protein [Actinomadura citrea]NYE17460.1 broad specificity phosphatase PhoE [Actinomadura citrea]GGU01086.1 histidine phosphatase family protein [Actinomadura citrea]